MPAAAARPLLSPPSANHDFSPAPPSVQGTVCGVLYYFPFQNDAETVPVENPLTSVKPASSPPLAAGRGTQLPGGPTQLGGGRATQMPAGKATQRPARATQGGGGCAAGMDDDEDEEAAGGWQSAPIFEAFWQGRLIPGARIDTLPFVESVRQKRNAQAKVGWRYGLGVRASC